MLIYAEQKKNRASFTSVAKRYAYFWEVSAYLSQRFDITSVDAIQPHVSLHALSRMLVLQNFSAVILCIRSHNVERSLEYASFFKLCRPDIKILVYGDIVSHLPDYFAQLGLFDAVVTGGDYECSISSYLDYLRSNDESNLSGVNAPDLKRNFAGKSLGTAWSFTNLDDAPYHIYNQMVTDKREMTVTVQRGCPYGCDYCLATKTFSTKPRLKDPTEVIAYCTQHQAKFDTFRLFAPVFTLDREWAKDLCRQMIAAGTRFKWCATTRYELLDDEELIDLIVRAGCYKLAVGIETIGDSALSIGRQDKLDTLRRVAGYVNKQRNRDYGSRSGMALTGLCMLGVPGQSKEDVATMFSLMEELQIRIRPTSYTPLEKLLDKPNLEVTDITRHDKFTFYDGGIAGVSPNDFYRLLFDPRRFREILQVEG